jgi:hypothetical protein
MAVAFCEPPRGSTSMNSTFANVSARTPRHSAIDLLKGATTFIATLESERMPFTESTMIFIDAGCVTGVNKTIDECNADSISMRILEPY